jgi:hypothetical protein
MTCVQIKITQVHHSSIGDIVTSTSVTVWFMEQWVVLERIVVCVVIPNKSIDVFNIGPNCCSPDSLMIIFPQGLTSVGF